jgi:DNA-binding TFAR19-related protein (PDSD5 family)
MNIDEIKQKKMEEMQQEFNEQIQIQQQIEQLEVVAKKFMTHNAVSRLNNLKLAHQDKAIKVIVSISQLVMKGQINEKINEKQLIDILKRMDIKKEFNIKRV